MEEPQDGLERADLTIDPGPGNETKWASFLDEFSQCGVITEAARKAGISRTTAYAWKNGSARCTLEWADAEEKAADVLRKEARRRAIDGVDKPLHYQGVIFAYERVYSDTLMGRLLQAHCPEHKQQADINLGGQAGKPIATVNAEVSSDLLDESDKQTIRDLALKAMIAKSAKDRGEK